MCHTIKYYNILKYLLVVFYDCNKKQKPTKNQTIEPIPASIPHLPGFGIPHLLQHDASQYGASAQQQRQQAHQDHSHVKGQTGIILRWRRKREEALAGLFLQYCVECRCQTQPVGNCFLADRGFAFDLFIVRFSPCPETLGSLHSLIFAWFSRWIFTLPL